MSEALHMSKAAQRVLDEFEALPEPDKHTVAIEIIRRSGSYGSPSDDELVLAAEEVFLDLDRRERGE